MEKLRVINVDGSLTECDADFTACQRAVGGYVEVIRTPADALLVNEDGLIIGMLPNKLASLLAGRPLVGPVVVVPKKLVKSVLG